MGGIGTLGALTNPIATKKEQVMHKLQRILVINEHPLIWLGLRVVLAEASDIEVLAQIDKGHESVATDGGLTPDLLLLDRSVADVNDFERLARNRRRYPDAHVLVVVPNGSENAIPASQPVDADGCIRVNATHAEFLLAIRNVLQGRSSLWR